MNGTLRRLVLGGMSALAVCWATRSGEARAAGHIGLDKNKSAMVCSSETAAEMKLACGSTRIFHASSGITSSHVEDPEIVDFVQFSPTEVSFQALKPGTTTVTLWSESDEKPITLVVHVANEESPAKVQATVTQVGYEEPSTATTAAPGARPMPSIPLANENNYVQQVPAISIENSSPIMATVGKIVEQVIVMKNVGSVVAEHVEVRGNVSIDSELIYTDPKADISESTLIWRFPRIPAGAQQKITIRVRPLVAGELSCHTNVSFKSSASVRVQIREPKLKLVCDGPASVTVGSEVRIALTVANVGTAPVEGVKIRQLVPGVTQTAGYTANTPAVLPVGTLHPGESRVLETVSIARNPGLVRVSLVAESLDGAQAAAEHTLRVTAPKLELTNSGPEFRYLKRRATYQMVLSNPGDSMATNVNLAVALPEGFEFISASSDGMFNAEKRTVTWIIGVLEANQKRDFSFTILPKTEGEHVQRIVAWADSNLIAKTEMKTRVEGLVSLLMEVVDVDDPIELGSETTYQIHILNRGTKAAERIQIVATLPEGLTATAVEGLGTYKVKGQQLIFEPIASVAPQTATVLQVRVKGVRIGTQRIRAVLNCASLRNAIITEEATEVYGE